MEKIEFTVPIKPIPKARPRKGLGGHFYVPSSKEEALLRYTIQPLAPDPKWTCPVKIEMEFSFEKPKSARRPYPSVRPDLDNLVKLTLDAMKDFWKDDAQIIDLVAKKRYASTPSIRVSATPLGPERANKYVSGPSEKPVEKVQSQ